MIIENYKPVNKGPVLGTFNLKVPKWGNFVIRECTYFDKNGAQWIGFPSRQYTNQQGEKKYFNFCLFEDKDMSYKFNELVIASLKTFLDKNPSLKQGSIQPKQLDAFPESQGVPF